MVVANERGSLILSSPAWPALPARSAGAPRPFCRRTAAFLLSVRFPCQARNVRLVAGMGSTTANYVFTFVFPLSLLTVMIIVSANKLDHKYLEEEADIYEDPEDHLRPNGPNGK